VSQTIAIFVDAYRSINSQKLFWVSLVISGLVVAAFACVGVNPQGLKVLFWQVDSSWFNSTTTPPALFYKQLFVTVGIDVWLSFSAAILALVSTAGIFPRLSEGGMIDLFVSKPISRLRLFATEYLAGLLFVTFQVTVFSVASLLVIGIRGGVWEPGLLAAVPLVVCFFSYLFAVCVLLGLLTRSTVAALLLTLLFWFIVSMLGRAEQNILVYQVMERRQAEFKVQSQRPASRGEAGSDGVGSAAEPGPAEAREPSAGGGGLETARRILGAINAVLPKTRETIALLQRWLIRLADLPAAADDPRQQATQRELQEALYRHSPLWILGTSLGFEAVVLACAAWVFCRRDY
jgi:hypothetical protein